MHLHAWLLFTGIALVAWGTAGLLQKVSTNFISADSALVWLIAGFVLLEPWLWKPDSAGYVVRDVVCAVLSGGLSALAFWALLEAMASGGKAAIVVPLTSMYPLLVVLIAPLVLHEHFTLQQGGGIVCGLGAIYLFAT